MLLVYSQTLVWLGVYFSPLLAVIGTGKLFVSFYVKKVTSGGLVGGEFGLRMQPSVVMSIRFSFVVFQNVIAHS